MPFVEDRPWRFLGFRFLSFSFFSDGVASQFVYLFLLFLTLFISASTFCRFLGLDVIAIRAMWHRSATK